MISGTGSTLFEELGLYYIGPLDGHNLDDLVAVLSGACSVTLYACSGWGHADLRVSSHKASSCLEST